tara:strand:- start:22608 stop:23093 length:486 start_codon:yes stop_codon:yes gene_type:complete
MKGLQLHSFSALSLAAVIACGAVLSPRGGELQVEVRGPWSVQDGGGSVQRRAWVELLAEDLPVREKDLVAFYHRERESFDGDLAASLFYLDVWDVIGRFGMPTSMCREASVSPGSFDWEFTYSGVDFVIKDEFDDMVLVRGLTFTFSADGLTCVDVVVDDD